jgi:hypothetical protein
MKLAAYRLFLVVTMLLCVSGLRFVSLAQVKPASRSMSTKPAIANSVILRVRATRQEVSTEDTPVPRKTRRVSQSPRIASSSKRITDNAANAAAPTLKTKEEKPVLAGGVSLIKTDNQVSFLVYGEPIALQRHRMLRSGMTYNPSSKQQKQFLDTCRSFLPSTPLQGPLEVRLVFHFKRPMNHYGSGRNSNVLKDGMDLWHSKRKGRFSACILFYKSVLKHSLIQGLL